jgi:hypothetical protein
VADWATIASLSTAAGTLVLAMATFGSVRSANRSARVAERSLMVGLRPVLVPSRPEDPPEKVTFIDRELTVPSGAAHVEEMDGKVYLAIPMRNVGAGLAVLHGWHVSPRRLVASDGRPDPEEFRLLQRDLYVAPGDRGYWQGALRDPEDDLLAPMLDVLRERHRFAIDVLYGDHEGGQRTISRFGISPREGTEWLCTVVRHWSVDGAGPRDVQI